MSTATPRAALSLPGLEPSRGDNISPPTPAVRPRRCRPGGSRDTAPLGSARLIGRAASLAVFAVGCGFAALSLPGLESSRGDNISPPTPAERRRRCRPGGSSDTAPLAQRGGSVERLPSPRPRTVARRPFGCGTAALSLFCLLAVLTVACSNFHEVEKDRFYRSAQPTAEQLTRWIWRYQIETVVRLRLGGPEDEAYRISRDAAAAAGIDFVAIPLSARRFPSHQSLVELCDVLDRARYPVLVHCRAGADRTGLVSAIYVLEQTSDLEQAREQLSFFPYQHLGWFGLDKPDLVLDLYEPWQAKLGFCEWARTIYAPPDGDELPAGFEEQERERAAAFVPPAKTGT